MKTKSQSIIRIYQSALATALLVAVAPGAFATTMNYASYDIYTPAGTSSDEQFSATTSASVTSSPGTSSAAASADFGVLKARAQASSAANTSGWGTTYGYADTSFQVTVGAAPPPPVGSGGSGVVFSNLDPVTLNMSFRIDGTLQAGSDPNAGAPTNSSLGSAGASANLRIIDRSILLNCGSPDGCYTPRLLSFGMNAYAESSDRGTGYAADDYYSWNWGVNTVDMLGISTGVQSDSGFGSSGSLNFDTGILTATVSTYIGAVLDINGYISLLAQSYIGGTSVIDFYNTMGLVFTAPEGVVLGYVDGITPAAYDLGTVSAVPLPAALPLFLSGLVGLGFLGRRRQKT